MRNIKNFFLRNNEDVKVANATERVTKEEYDRRIAEIKKCKADPIYFAENYYNIVSIDKGKHIIEMYPKQKELLKAMQKNNRLTCLAARQCGKTTTYSIFSLWLTIFNPDQHVLICANTGDSAVEFLSKIRMAYELLPMWLKPGCKTYNKKKIVFGNDSSITSAMTSPAVRGRTGGLLILDECAFVEANMMSQFWTGAYPIVSSSKKSKVFMVSTPNGTGNLFYDIYSNAELNKNGWTPFRIDWFEVPGRDENWKKIQMESFNNDSRKFAQEFGNCESFSTRINLYNTKIKQYQEIAIGKLYNEIEQRRNSKKKK